MYPVSHTKAQGRNIQIWWPISPLKFTSQCNGVQNCSNCTLYSTTCEYASARKKSGPPKGYTRKNSKNAPTRPASESSSSDLQLVTQPQSMQQAQHIQEPQHILQPGRSTPDPHQIQFNQVYPNYHVSVAASSSQQYPAPPDPPSSEANWASLFTSWSGSAVPPINGKSELTLQVAIATFCHFRL
jgi:hypothetical protein